MYIEGFGENEWTDGERGEGVVDKSQAMPTEGCYHPRWDRKMSSMRENPTHKEVALCHCS